MFESDKASRDFCKEVTPSSILTSITCIRSPYCCLETDLLYAYQVCLAKVNSEVALEAVVVQDLGLGEGQAVENGDSLEVVYTGWLLQNHAIGQVSHFHHYFPLVRCDCFDGTQLTES